LVQHNTILPQFDSFISSVFVNLLEPNIASNVRDRTTDKISKGIDSEILKNSCVECVAICYDDIVGKG